MPHRFEHELTHGERLIRLQTVVEHLSDSHRQTWAHGQANTQSIGRLASRVEHQEKVTLHHATILSRLEGLPARIEAQERQSADRKRAKEERREMRREALALMKWGATFVLILATALGYVPEGTFKTLTSALGLGK